MSIGYMDNRHIVKPDDERRQRKAMPNAALAALHSATEQRKVERLDEMMIYLKTFYRAFGNFPTVREIVVALNLKSNDMVMRDLYALKHSGRIVAISGPYKHSRYTLPEVLEALKSL